jgi:hypothetical protein
LLEEVRLLANSETTTEKLLPVILAGQPELQDRLNQYHMRHLKQRIALRCEIAPFTLHETAEYIASRIRAAGGDPLALFTREAVILIHEQSRGIPRTISTVCDNALLTGFALGQRPIDAAIIQEVSRDFHLAAGAMRTVAPRSNGPQGAPSDLEPAAADDGPLAPQTAGDKLFVTDGKSSRTSWLKEHFVPFPLRRGADGKQGVR